MCRYSCFEPATCVDRATVVNSCCTRKVGIICPPSLINAVGQPISGISSGSPLSDHLLNDRRRAWVLDDVSDIRVASSVAIMVLHQPWIADAIVASWHPDAATGFLQDDCKNETVINACFGGHLLNGIPDSTLAKTLAKTRTRSPV